MGSRVGLAVHMKHTMHCNGVADSNVAYVLYIIVPEPSTIRIDMHELNPTTACSPGDSLGVLTKLFRFSSVSVKALFKISSTFSTGKSSPYRFSEQEVLRCGLDPGHQGESGCWRQCVRGATAGRGIQAWRAQTSLTSCIDACIRSDRSSGNTWGTLLGCTVHTLSSAARELRDQV